MSEGLTSRAHHGGECSGPRDDGEGLSPVIPGMISVVIVSLCRCVGSLWLRAGAPLDGQTVARRGNRALQQGILRLLHPLPQALVQLALHVGTLRTARQVVLLERVGVQIVELDHLLAVGGIAPGVGAEERASLDIAGDLHGEGGREVADVLEARGSPDEDVVSCE